MTKAIVALGVVALGLSTGFVAGRARRGSASSPLNVRRQIASTNSALQEARTGHKHWRWSSIESEDMEQYIANLRAMGCPEQTIADIIRGKVYAMYQERVNRIFNPLARYWSTAEEIRAVDEKVRAIRKERDQLLAGAGMEGVQGVGSSGIASEKQRYIDEALTRYPKQVLGLDATAEERQAALEARKARVAYLSQVLTPDELLTYRVTQDGNSGGIAFLLRPVHPTDEEFRAVFSALDGENLSVTNGFLAPAVEAKLEQALGDERYAEYQAQHTPENAAVNMFGYLHHLTDSQIQQLKAVRASRSSMDMGKYRQAVSDIFQNDKLVNTYFSSIGTVTLDQGEGQ